MTTQVTIQHTRPDGTTDQQVVGVTQEAIKRARLSFNPSGDARVTRIKALVAALYSELQQLNLESVNVTADVGVTTVINREAATAATHIQAGAMFAVSAATAHLA